jgi:hypothetical protein
MRQEGVPWTDCFVSRLSYRSPDQANARGSRRALTKATTPPAAGSNRMLAGNGDGFTEPDTMSVGRADAELPQAPRFG